MKLSRRTHLESGWMSQRMHQIESEERPLCWHCVLQDLHALEAEQNRKKEMEKTMNALNIKYIQIQHTDAYTIETNTDSHKNCEGKLLKIIENVYTFVLMSTWEI